MPPETRYLRELTRTWLAGDTVAGAPPDGLDWDRLLALLRDHHVVTVLGPLLLAGPLPAQHRDALASEVRDAGLRTAVMLLELERILPALEVADCRPLLLKGAALAIDVYPTPEQRWFLDVDVLVPVAQRDTALALLTDLGYHGDDERHDPHYYDTHHFHRIVRSGQGLVLEVHWAITLDRSVYTYDLDAMQRDAGSVALGATTARVPAAVDLILHTVLQNTAGGFEDLRRVLDAALLERRLTAADRETLVTRAHACNLATALWLQYRLLEAVTGLRAPEAMLKAVQPSAGTRRCLTSVPVAELCLSGRPDGRRDAPLAYPYLLHCLCAPGARWRTREIARFVFPDEGGRQEAGLRPEQSRGLGQRAILTLQRLKSAGLATGYLAGRLLTRR